MLQTCAVLVQFPAITKSHDVFSVCQLIRLLGHVWQGRIKLARPRNLAACSFPSYQGGALAPHRLHITVAAVAIYIACFSAVTEAYAACMQHADLCLGPRVGYKGSKK